MMKFDLTSEETRQLLFQLLYTCISYVCSRWPRDTIMHAMLVHTYTQPHNTYITQVLHF